MAGSEPTEIEVSVIIPARNATATLERTLRSLGEQEFGGAYEVIVVDDGSDDDTASIARRYAPLVNLLVNDSPIGAGASRNRGVGVARGPVLAFIDADCYPTPGWLQRAMIAIDNADLVQGAVEPNPTVRRTPFDRSLQVEQDRGFYQTANLLVRRDMFDRVSGFHDWTLERARWSKLSLDGPTRVASQKPVGEDTVFGWMACRAGARSAFAPDALVYHEVFRGGLRDDLADRWHWARHMPAVVRLVPELRDTMFCRRWFFSRWTAQFDLAATCVLAALVFRRRVLLLGAAPYARRVSLGALQYGRWGAIRAALGAPFTEAATLAGFIVGSLVSRTVVL